MFMWYVSCFPDLLHRKGTIVSESQWQLSTPKYTYTIPDSKVHGANMGPIWGQQDPGGHHVGRMNVDIWDTTS